MKLCSLFSAPSYSRDNQVSGEKRILGATGQCCSGMPKNGRRDSIQRKCLRAAYPCVGFWWSYKSPWLQRAWEYLLLYVIEGPLSTGRLYFRTSSVEVGLSGNSMLERSTREVVDAGCRRWRIQKKWPMQHFREGPDTNTKSVMNPVIGDLVVKKRCVAVHNIFFDSREPS